MSATGGPVEAPFARAWESRAPSPRAGWEARFDEASWILIGLVFLAMLAAWPKHVPAMSDTWYHLAIADRALERGGVPLWDDWEFAPHGRPNLYPPVLHLLLSAIGAVTGGVLNAGRVMAVLVLPTALFSTWFAARRILGPRAAFLAVVLCLLDVTQFIVMEAYIAACLTNILAPLVALAVVERRPWPGVVGMTVLYYSHLGFPHMVALGLLLFGLVERAYLRTVLKVVGIAFLWWTPYLAHVLGHAEWIAAVFRGGGLPMPLLQKVFSLQILNPIILLCGALGARALWRAGGPGRVVPCMMLGFLPILLSYGGRYMMHSMPFWAAAGAVCLQRIAPPEATRLRLALLSLATLLPTPAVGVFGKPTPLPFTTPIALVASLCTPEGLLGDQGEKSERYRADCEDLAAWLRANTPPDEVIATNTEWIADSIALLADRRTDFGAWWECGTEASKRSNRAWREDRPSGVFVAIKPENDAGSILRKTEAMPGVDEMTEIGRFVVGVRRPHDLTGPARDVLPSAFERIPGAAARLSVRGDLLEWSVADAPAKAAGILADLGPDGVAAGGVELRVRSDRAEPLAIALVTAEGEELSARVTLPREGEWRQVRIPLAWMTLAGAPRADALAGRGSVTVRRVYLLWSQEKGEAQRDVEVHHVRLLTKAHPGMDAD